MRAMKAVGLCLSTALIIGTIGISGCTTTKPGQVRSNYYGTGTRLNTTNYDNRANNNVYGPYGYGTGMSANSYHQFSKIRMSKEIADKVITVPGVQKANVALTDHTAYVAVTLKNVNQMGKKSTTRYNVRSLSEYTDGRGLMGTNATGTGHMGLGYRDGNIAGRGLTGGSMTGRGYTGGGMTGTGYTDGNIAGKGFTGGSMTGRGYTDGNTSGLGAGYTTNKWGRPNNIAGGRYPAGNYSPYSTPGSTVNNFTDRTSTTDMMVTDELKRKITDVVKKTDSKINNVFVSANPDLYARFSDYAMRLQKGEPVSGLITEFRTLVNRIFPMNTGTTYHPSYYNNYNYDRTYNTTYSNTPTLPRNYAPYKTDSHYRNGMLP